MPCGDITITLIQSVAFPRRAVQTEAKPNVSLRLHLQVTNVRRRSTGGEGGQAGKEAMAQASATIATLQEDVGGLKNKVAAGWDPPS